MATAEFCNLEDQVLFLPTCRGPEFMILAFCKVKAEGSEGNNWEHMG